MHLYQRKYKNQCFGVVCPTSQFPQLVLLAGYSDL